MQSEQSAVNWLTQWAESRSWVFNDRQPDHVPTLATMAVADQSPKGLREYEGAAKHIRENGGRHRGAHAVEADGWRYIVAPGEGRPSKIVCQPVD